MRKAGRADWRPGLQAGSDKLRMLAAALRAVKEAKLDGCHIYRALTVFGVDAELADAVVLALAADSLVGVEPIRETP